MVQFFIFLSVLVIISILAYVVHRFIVSKYSEIITDVSVTEDLTEQNITNEYEKIIAFDELTELSEQEESKLIEIKDKALLSRIDNAIPGTFQFIANTKAVKNYNDTAKSVGQLYQAIIPKGAVLDNSRDMEGAVRGSYRVVKNSIKGNANWIAVDNKAVNDLAVISATNAVMNVASMIVGQYYMSQINNQLEYINASIEKIADFQQTEFKSKVYALVAEIHKASIFQVETIESDELRNRELTFLKELEHQCAQLLGQVNISLQNISNKTGLDYKMYEKNINEAETWFQYQHILLELLYKISELTYALNIGAITKENSYALYDTYAKQTKETYEKLNDWHKEHVERLKIDVEEQRRKKTGIAGFFVSPFGLINDNFNYKKISPDTVTRIEHQSENISFIREDDENDLYQKNVRLIVKDGKLYYLPS